VTKPLSFLEKIEGKTTEAFNRIWERQWKILDSTKLTQSYIEKFPFVPLIPETHPHIYHDNIVKEFLSGANFLSSLKHDDNRFHEIMRKTSLERDIAKRIANRQLNSRMDFMKFVQAELLKHDIRHKELLNYRFHNMVKNTQFHRLRVADKHSFPPMDSKTLLAGSDMQGKLLAIYPSMQNQGVPETKSHELKPVANLHFESIRTDSSAYKQFNERQASANFLSTQNFVKKNLK
jgi:hypothetical protein